MFCTDFNGKIIINWSQIFTVFQKKKDDDDENIVLPDLK